MTKKHFKILLFFSALSHTINLCGDAWFHCLKTFLKKRQSLSLQRSEQKKLQRKNQKLLQKKTTKKRSKKKKSSTTKSRSTSNPWSGTPAEDVYEDIERGGAPEPEPEPSPEPSPQPSQPSPGPSPSQPPSPWSGTPAEEIYEDISRGGAPPPQQPFVGPPAPSAPTPTLVPTPQEKFKHDVAQSLPGKLKTDQLQATISPKDIWILSRRLENSKTVLITNRRITSPP